MLKGLGLEKKMSTRMIDKSSPLGEKEKTSLYTIIYQLKSGSLKIGLAFLDSNPLVTNLVKPRNWKFF